MKKKLLKNLKPKDEDKENTFEDIIQKSVALRFEKEVEKFGLQIDEKLEPIEDFKDEINAVEKITEKIAQQMKESIDAIYTKINEAQESVGESFNLSDKQYSALSTAISELRTNVNESFLNASKRNGGFEEAIAKLPSLVEERIKEIRSYIALEIKRIDDLKVSEELKKIWKLLLQVEKIAKEYPTGGSGFPDVVVNGGKVVNNSAFWNFKNGNGTVAHVSQNPLTGLLDISFDSTSIGSEILIPTGAINNSNVNFVFAQKPTVIIVNGAIYRETKGWSWTGFTATLDYPVGTSGDIYGIS